MFDSNDLISLNSYTLRMLNALVLVAIALVAVVGEFVPISNYVMPHIHHFCQNKLGALHCYKIQYLNSFNSDVRVSM